MWSPCVLGRTREDHHCRWKKKPLRSPNSSLHMSVCVSAFCFCESQLKGFSFAFVWRVGESRMAKRRILASIYFGLYIDLPIYNCFMIYIMAGTLWLCVLSGGCCERHSLEMIAFNKVESAIYIAVQRQCLSPTSGVVCIPTLLVCLLALPISLSLNAPARVAVLAPFALWTRIEWLW